MQGSVREGFNDSISSTKSKNSKTPPTETEVAYAKDPIPGRWFRSPTGTERKISKRRILVVRAWERGHFHGGVRTGGKRH